MLADVQRAIAARPAGSRLLVLSDFDGTLAEFDPDPAAPRPSAETAALLARVAARADLSFGVVSGRRVSDLRSRVDVPDHVYLAGLHGLEIEIGARRWQHPDFDAAVADVRRLHDRLRRERPDEPGTLIEDKGASVAVHVRAVAAEARDRVLAWADACGADAVASGRLRRLHGSFVIEFLPNIPADKGRALRWIAGDVAEHHGTAPWVIYLGDDVTDEDAFGAIEHGVGVLVGSRATRATCKLPDISGVNALLAWLADAPAT